MVRRGSATGRCLVALGLLALVPGCPRKAPPPPPPAQSPEQPLAPWAWYKLGGLLVVTGEVDAPTDLVLKGRTLDERLHVEFGPVRWEMYAPPPKETAELRTQDGRLLATWDFDHPLPEPGPPSQPAPEAVPPVPPAKPAPPARKPAPQPRPGPAPRATKPVQPKPPAPPAAPRPWPDTHLPLAQGPARKPPVRKPAPTPARPAATPLPPKPPAAPRAAAPGTPKPPVQIPAPRPWPDTHLPLARGPKPRPAPRPEPAPPAQVPVVVQAPSPLPSQVAKAASAPPQPHPIPLEPPPVVLSPRPQAVPVPPFRPAPSPTLEWPGAGEAFNLVRGAQGRHWVCMTFDGGSSAEVAMDVLDALKERGIRTTFFLTGAFIEKYPDLVRRIDRDGHEIGNHTMDHPHLAPGGRRDPRWTKERFQQQLLQADALLLKVLGRPMDPYWRAPYGENTAELRKWAEELGYRHVYWSEGADTLDWATTKERKLYRTGNAILDRLHARMTRNDGDGLIVLMHLGSGRPESDRPARVLGPFLDRALEEGWNFVNVGAYLKDTGKPPWNSTNRLATLGQIAARQ